MTAKRSNIIASITVALCDFLLVLATFQVSYLIRFHSGMIPLFYPEIPPVGVYISGSAFVGLVTVAIFRFLGLYRLPRPTAYSGEMLKVFEGVTFASLIAMATTFIYRSVGYSRIVFMLAWGLGLVLIWTERYLVRKVLQVLFASGRLLTRVAIVGSGPMSSAIVERLKSNPHLGYRIAGFIGEGQPPGGLTVLGELENLRRIIVDSKLDCLLITLPYSSHDQLIGILKQVEGIRAQIRFVPDLFGLIATRAEVYELEGIPLIGLKPFPLDPWGRMLKRVIDVVFSLLFLVVFSPIIGLIALAIRIESPGSILYRQERIGCDGRKFTLYKFRSMYPDAEASGPVWGKGANDPRCTKVGKVLRLTGLDEIPQLYNVIKGEMSMIGPRPERPCFVDQFAGNIPGYLDRHRVKSGLTGWAQVNGLRGDTSVRLRTEYDIYYVENWSLMLDLRIMLMTIKHLLTQQCRQARQEMEM